MPARFSNQRDDLSGALAVDLKETPVGVNSLVASVVLGLTRQGRLNRQRRRARRGFCALSPPLSSCQIPIWPFSGPCLCVPGPLSRHLFHHLRRTVVTIKARSPK
jgi:hypothetical protein